VTHFVVVLLVVWLRKSSTCGRVLWEAHVPIRIDVIASEIFFATRLDLGEGISIGLQ
jgi:hypothetical protein